MYYYKEKNLDFIWKINNKKINISKNKGQTNKTEFKSYYWKKFGKLDVFKMKRFHGKCVCVCWEGSMLGTGGRKILLRRQKRLMCWREGEYQWTQKVTWLLRTFIMVLDRSTHTLLWVWPWFLLAKPSYCI